MEGNKGGEEEELGKREGGEGVRILGEARRGKEE